MNQPEEKDWRKDLTWEKKANIVSMHWIIKVSGHLFHRWATLKENREEHFDALMEGNIRYELKNRRKDYGDILVETLSCKERGTPGWIYNTQTDYLAYTVVTKERQVAKGYIFIFPRFQKWWNEEGVYNHYEPKRHVGELYTTKNRAVPPKDIPLDCFYYHPEYGLLSDKGYKID